MFSDFDVLARCSDSFCGCLLNLELLEINMLQGVTGMTRKSEGKKRRLRGNGGIRTLVGCTMRKRTDFGQLSTQLESVAELSA
jgi:hypothetical protein